MRSPNGDTNAMSTEFPPLFKGEGSGEGCPQFNCIVPAKETTEKKLISPKAVFVYLLCAAGRLIKPNFFPDSCQRPACGNRFNS
jgi:hypothetical protein